MLQGMDEVSKRLLTVVNEHLRSGLRGWAVLDGASFDDLPAELEEADFPHVSLFEPQVDRETRMLGPWIAELHEVFGPEPALGGPADASDEALREWALELSERARSALEHGDHTGDALLDRGVVQADPVSRALTLLGRIASEARDTVFWFSRDARTDDLRKHLRTLNQAQMPVDLDVFQAPPEPPEDRFETLSFRHADGDVLRQTLPVLRDAQLNRFLGRFAAVVFAGPRFAPPGEVPIHVALPVPGVEAKPGVLRIDRDQMRRMNDIRLRRSRIETVAYLRDAAEEETAGMDDDALMGVVIRAERYGFGGGVEDIDAHYLLAYLAVVTGGGVLDDDVLLRQLQRSGRPDDEMRRVFDGFVEYLAAEDD